MFINYRYFVIPSICISAMLLCSCSPAESSEESTSSDDVPQTTQIVRIVLDHSEEIMIDDLPSGDDDFLLENSVDYLYPDDCYFKPKLMNDEGFLFGDKSDEHGSTKYALLSLNLNTGEYQEIAQAASKDYFTQMIVIYCNNDYLIYNEVCMDVATEAGLYNTVYYLDLKTLEKTQLFHEENGIPFNTCYADSDDQNAFMFSIGCLRNNRVEMYYVSREDLKPELVTINASMPVYVNNNWYCITEDRGLGVIQNGSINKIEIEQLEGDVYEIHAIDEKTILLTDAKNDDGSLSSSMYMVNMLDYSTTYLFSQDTLMEMAAGNSRFVKWKGGQLKDGYALRDNLYDYRSGKLYHFPTNYIYMCENGFSYRKFLVHPSEALPGTMMDRDKTCISYVKLK